MARTAVDAITAWANQPAGKPGTARSLTTAKAATKFGCSRHQAWRILSALARGDDAPLVRATNPDGTTKGRPEFTYTRKVTLATR